MSEPATPESQAAASPIEDVSAHTSSWPSLPSVAGTYKRNGETHQWAATCTVFWRSSNPQKPCIFGLKVSLMTDTGKSGDLTPEEEALFESAILKHATSAGNN